MIDNEEFVRVWQNAYSAKQVAEHFGMTSGGTASTHAYYLRKKGVQLKKFPRGQGLPIDVDRLNQIIDE